MFTWMARERVAQNAALAGSARPDARVRGNALGRAAAGVLRAVMLASLAALAGCGAGQVRPVDSSAPAMEGYHNVDDLYIVDCLLPGQVRQMGKMTYLSPRKPIKTTAIDCRVRGGEYVAYDRADYRSALKVWQGRAEAGDADAQVIVGEIYERGMGTAPDYAKAAEWYRKAAEQGNEKAQTNLGYLYEQGLGVKQDMVAAINWYRKAAGDNGDELMLASAAKEKIDRLKSQLEDEQKKSEAQKQALQNQIEQLQQRLQQQQGGQADNEQTIKALQSLLDQTNQKLAEQSQRLDQLRHVDVQSSTAVTRGGGAALPTHLGDFNFGRYYALVVGLEKYKYWGNLQTPYADAKTIADLLSKKYGFSTTVMLDASAQDILSKLNDLREQLGKDDNLLIYFAGHGQLRQSVEDQSKLGYWLPVNAQRDRTTFWLPNSQINEQLALLQARSVLVIADSCYAGAMSTDPASLLVGGGGRLSDPIIKLGLERRARYILSSGGLHPVMDRGEGVHSLFANALIEVLQNNHGLLREQDLFQDVSAQMAVRAEKMGVEQKPELRPIRAAGHNPGGSFFLVPRDVKSVASHTKSLNPPGRQGG